MKLQDQLMILLKDLSNKSPILGAAIFSVEGLPLVSHFHAGTEEVSVAAMVAGIHAAGEQTVKELKQASEIDQKISKNIFKNVCGNQKSN